MNLPKNTKTHQRSRRLANAIAKAGISLIAVDFDRTIVDIHTGGRYKQNGAVLSAHRPLFVSPLRNSLPGRSRQPAI